MENGLNITWDCPVLSNGPLDYFQILMEGHNASKVQIFNVTGLNYLNVNPNCSENEDDAVYNFRVRAVNIRNNSHLYGRYSNPAKSRLCSGGEFSKIILGIVVPLYSVGYKDSHKLYMPSLL